MAKTVDYVAFLILYFIYVIMCLILLLNLLIAMMGHTFDRILKASTLKWRVAFAQRVLRIELQSQFLARRFKWWDPRVGVDKPGVAHRVVYFQNVVPNAEGYGTGGVRSVFDMEVEKEGALSMQDERELSSMEQAAAESEVASLTSTAESARKVRGATKLQRWSLHTVTKTAILARSGTAKLTRSGTVLLDSAATAAAIAAAASTDVISRATGLDLDRDGEIGQPNSSTTEAGHPEHAQPQGTPRRVPHPETTFEEA